MKKVLNFAQFFLISFFLLFISYSNVFSAELQGKIIKVSDGDTIWVRLENGNRVKVRIWGIDTPEKFPSRKLYKSARYCHVTPEEEVHLGKLASEKAKQILDHLKVKLITHGRGYYGRLLAEIILPDGTNYGILMIKEGFACVYWKNHNPVYLRALKKAKKERRGLWSIDYNLMKCLCGR